MIEIFFKSKGQIVCDKNLTLLEELGFDDVLWIDLFEPTGDEKRAVEEFLESAFCMTLRECSLSSHSIPVEKPTPRPKSLSWREPTLEVMMMTVLRKSMRRPFPSVRRPSSVTCNSRLKTSA